MKILHVITSLRTGGAEKLMVSLLPKLRDLGNEIELLLFDGVRTEFMNQLEATGIRIHVIRVGGNVYNPGNIFYLRNLLNKYDIVHTHNTSPQLYAVVAKSLIWGCSVKLVTTEHNTTNRRRNKFFFKYLDRWMYNKYAKIICISKQAEKNLRTYLDDDSPKICTIFNGIDFFNFSKLSVGSENPNREEKDVIVTMVAAFREQKDQQTLIRSISLLPDNFKLQLVGTGEKKLIRECEKLVNESKLSDRVFFMGMRNDIAQILHASDIVVLSSHYEGLSLSSLEGMASGKPFVASDVDGLHEIVCGYGLLFPHEDACSLAEILLKLSKDQHYAEFIARKCQERAKQFDIEEMSKQYIKVYQEII